MLCRAAAKGSGTYLFKMHRSPAPLSQIWDRGVRGGGRRGASTFITLHLNPSSMWMNFSCMWVAFTCARSWRVSADDDEEVLGRGTHDGPEAPLTLLDVLYSIKIDVGSFSLSSRAGRATAYLEGSQHIRHTSIVLLYRKYTPVQLLVLSTVKKNRWGRSVG